MLLEERLFSSRSPDDQVHVVDVAQHVASSHPPALDLDDVHFHREEREEEEEDREVASLRDVPEGIDGAFGCCFPRRPVRVKLSSSSMEGRKLHNGRHPRKQNGSLFRAQGTHPSSSLEPLLSNQLTDQKEVDGETFLQNFVDEHMGIDFDENLPSHRDELNEFWKISFPEEDVPQRPDSRWRRLGFQGDDPVTDLRGMGMLSVRLLTYFAKRYPRDYEQTRCRADMDMLNGGYPFACAGVNVCFLLVDCMQLRKSSQAPPKQDPVATKCRRTLSRILSKDSNGFQELFCACFVLLELLWTKKKATYLQFPMVAKATREQLTKVMEKSNVESIKQLRGKLGISEGS